MSEQDFGPWSDLVQLGTKKAMAGLSEMIGADIEVNDLALKRVPVTEVSNAFGGRDQEAVGIYLSVSGSADGHLMLMYEPSIALAFVDLLMGQPVSTTDSLDGMGRSALGEMGNIIGAFFLGAIADATGLALSPSPPTVMTDMAGALLDVVSADILLTQDDTYVAEATFRVHGQDINGVFMVMPTQELFETIVNSTKVA
ncbi:MAG: chemotaxis protein CheC [Dehalococcoidia bacterium]